MPIPNLHYYKGKLYSWFYRLNDPEKCLCYRILQEDGGFGDIHKAPNTRLRGNPSVFPYKGKLLIAYRAENNNNELYFTTFDGENFEPAKRIPNVGVSGSPNIIPLGERIDIYHHGYNYNNELWLTTSYDDGETWSNDTRVGKQRINGSPFAYPTWVDGDPCANIFFPAGPGSVGESFPGIGKNLVVITKSISGKFDNINVIPFSNIDNRWVVMCPSILHDKFTKTILLIYIDGNDTECAGDIVIGELDLYDSSGELNWNYKGEVTRLGEVKYVEVSNMMPYNKNRGVIFYARSSDNLLYKFRFSYTKTPSINIEKIEVKDQ